MTTRRKIKRKKTIYLIFIVPIIFFLLFTGFRFIKNKYDQVLGRSTSPDNHIVSPGSSPTLTAPSITKIPVVMFHYVEYIQDPGETLRMKLNTNPFLFNLQLKALKDNNYQTFFVKDIPWLLQNRMTNNKSIILTFDDGYVDFYRNVFPLLKEYHFKATIYVIFYYIGRPGFMSEQQIRDVLASGLIEVGAHTLNHPGLASLPNIQAEEEITGGKKKLEEMLGIKVKTFAYPGGSYNSSTIELVKKAGYEVGLTTNPGVGFSKKYLYELPRIRAGYLTPSLISDYFEKLGLR